MVLRAWFISWLVLGSWLCSGAGASETLKIVTTFLPAYSFAANVAGGAAQVENLLPGQVSLHDYQLTPGDLRKLAAADLIVANGLGLETFLDKAVANTGPGTAGKIVRLSAGLERELIEDADPHHHHEPGHDHAHNPHTWLDPRLAMHGVTNLLHALEARDPANAARYRANAAAYLARLAALDREIEEKTGPVRATAFVTYHNAFPYFVRRYGLSLAGVVEQVPEIPPSPREMSQLHRTIRERKVKALFAEPGGGTRLARQIAGDARIELAELDPLETGTLAADSYESGMRRNLDSLVKALSR